MLFSGGVNSGKRYLCLLCPLDGGTDIAFLFLILYARSLQLFFFNYCILAVKSNNFKILAISRVNKHFFATMFYVIPFETDWSHVAACTAAASRAEYVNPKRCVKCDLPFSTVNENSGLR